MSCADIKEIKEYLSHIAYRLMFIENSIEKIFCHMIEATEVCINPSKNEVDIRKIEDIIEGVFSSENEFNSINRIHDKLNELLGGQRRAEQVELASATLDKFDDYMRNVDKLNCMVNEFKGCVSMARGSLEDRKKLNDQISDNAVLVDITKEIQSTMLRFIEATSKLEHKYSYKIDYIYENMFKIAGFLQNQEKKPRKVRKSAKKKNLSGA